jgi:SagB-type dehydrogenase family enzyme
VPEKLRRSSTLTLYWEKGGLVCEDYLTHERAALTPDLVDLLERFSKPTDPERVVRGMEEKPALVSQAIRQLLALGFLKKGEDAAEKALARWHWGHAAKQYLFGTKDAHQFFPIPQRLAYAKRLMKKSRQPALYKSYPAKTKTRLVRPEGYASEANATLSRVRNCRDYSGRPISREALSEILFLAWGEQGKIHPKPWGTLLEKTSYSGGNRHPVEVYPIVVNVEGLASGLYHYNVRDHALEILKRGNFGAVARRIGNRQEWIKGAAVHFLMTAVWDRTMFKYRHEYVSRTIFCDVGHLSQSMYVAAAGLGLGACTTYAMNHSPAEEFLGVDGLDESCLSLSMVGRPNLKPY